LISINHNWSNVILREVARGHINQKNIITDMWCI
jgi:hypothetical protein